MISREDIAKLAELARLELSPAEQERLTKDVDSILAYISQIQAVSSEHEMRPAHLPEVPYNVMRDDAGPHESGLYTEALLSAAPKREGQYVKVKKIL